MGRYEQRRVDELEDEIERSRTHINNTLHELESRFTPERIRHNVVAHMPSSDNAFLHNLGRSLREYPMPALVTGIGLGWLMISQLRSQRRTASTPQLTARSMPLAIREEAPQRMVATHLGTQQGRGGRSTHRPDVIGEATHLGTSQGWSGYVYPH